MKKTALIIAITATCITTNAQQPIPPCTELFISEYVEGNFNNKALEIYNPTNSPVNLSNYQVGRADNGNITPMLISLGNATIAPFGTYVVVIDKRNPAGTGQETPVLPALQAKADTFLDPQYLDADGSPMYFNGNDAVVLTKNSGTTLLDLIGKIGENPGEGWSPPGDTIWWTKDHTLIRKYNVKAGVNANPATFDPSAEWDSLPENTFDSLGTHNCACNVVGLDEFKSLGFTFYPNPISTGKLYLKADVEMLSAKLYSLQGKLLTFQNINTPNATLQIPDLPKGIYSLRIQFVNGRTVNKKVVFYN